MAPERPENQEGRRPPERRPGRNLIDIAYQELLRLISELQNTITGRQRQGQPVRQEEEQLQRYEQERQQRLDRFRRHEYGRRVERERPGIIQPAQEAIQNLRAAAPDQRDRLQAEARRALEQQAQQAAELIRSEPQDLEEALKGIAQTELQELVNLRREYNQIVAGRGGQEQAVPAGDQLPEGWEEIVRELPANAEDRARIAARLAAEARAAGPRSQYRDQSIFTEERMRHIQEDTDEGRETREEVFDELMSIVDSFPSQNFHEALDLQTMSSLADFRRILHGIRGETGTQIIAEYMTKLKMKMMLHNTVWVVEQGAGKPDDLQKMLEQFGPELFDQLFQYEGADLAARLYEIGVETLRSRNDNYVPYESMVSDPKKHHRSEIDDWVRERFIATLMAEDRDLSVEEFRRNGRSKKSGGFWPWLKVMK